jgi:chemotaxis protein methyltransferase CheR
MTTPSAKEKYFQKTSTGKFQVSPEIKRLVHFSFLNLADNAYPSLSTGTNAMDAIWCRNVLIYMGHETARRIVHSFHDCLVDGGVLVVSPTETSAIRCSGLVAATPHGAPVYRRTAPLHESQRMQAPSSIAPLPPSPQLPRHANETSVAPAAPEDPIRTAWALYEKRLYREAEEILGDVLLERPDNAEANALLARVCANEGKLGDAAKWCGKALAADKLNPAYYYLQATVLQEQDEIERAVACLKQALYLNRDFVLAHFALGNLARLQGKLSESRKHFAIALALLTDIDDNEIVPESDGLTAGRLVQIIVGTKEGTPSP